MTLGLLGDPSAMWLRLLHGPQRALSAAACVSPSRALPPPAPCMPAPSTGAGALTLPGSVVQPSTHPLISAFPPYSPAVLTYTCISTVHMRTAIASPRQCLRSLRWLCRPGWRSIHSGVVRRRRCCGPCERQCALPPLGAACLRLRRCWLGGAACVSARVCEGGTPHLWARVRVV